MSYELGAILANYRSTMILLILGLQGSPEGIALWSNEYS
jgi:hypothetical protein